MKHKIFSTISLIVIFFIIATSARAAISCAPYGVNVAKWPQDGIHAFRCTNTSTGIKPTDSRATTLFNRLSDVRFPPAVKTKLTSANVKYFFFNNRADAIEYFNATAPYKGPIFSIVHPFADAESRCANTGSALSFTAGHVIAVAIYNNCQLDHLIPKKQIVNPSLERTIMHESGHALDFSLASSGFDISDIPSSHMSAIALYDRNRLTPSNWLAMTATQRNNYVCTLFNPSYWPSEIEIELGAIKNGGPKYQVCKQSSPAIRYSDFVGLSPNDDATPTQIAISKMPYFVNIKRETWAELFVLGTFWGIDSPVAFLAFTDKAIGNTYISPRSFNCFRAVMAAYIVKPDNPSISLPAGCPAIN